MTKAVACFSCSQCGAQYRQWQGQCRDCAQWNTLEPSAQQERTGNGNVAANVAYPLNSIEIRPTPRIASGNAELDRVLGGGLVEGATILIGGAPGAGKTTLLLQTLAALTTRCRALYISGEESVNQIALHGRRLGLGAVPLPLCSETSIQRVIATARAACAQLLVVDSIQVMRDEEIAATAGTVSQVRACASQLILFAREQRCTVLLTGHVTKEGALAGPRVLEHAIDCSLMLEPSADSRFRTLRAQKNRFGAVNELGIFAMTEQGMKAVKNPSAIFLSRALEPASGVLVTVAREGSRPLLVEIQALVDDGSGYTRRLCVGLDAQRLNLLLAVLHRHGGLSLSGQDVFVNLAGGVKIEDTCADLALALALASSIRNLPIARSWIAFGEIGLNGEIRPVPYGVERISEAAKHGFDTAVVPAANCPKTAIAGIKVIGVNRLSAALEVIKDAE